MATARLPLRDLTTSDLQRARFLVARDGPLAVYWCPSDPPARSNPRARVMFVGLTPGSHQACLALQMARQSLRATPQLSYADACRRANRRAAFDGMREQMCTWLDALHVNTHLGFDSCASLFKERRDLLAVTSAVRYPVFINGTNYNGSRGGRLTRHRVLLPFIETLLADDVRRVPNALVVPLGKAVEGALEYLVETDSLASERVLFGFPHPSAANGWKARQWRANRSSLRRQVDAFLGR